MRSIDRDPRPGSRLIIANRYEIDVDNPLGRGGMAMVYVGHDLKTRRKVAVKTLRPEYQRDPESRQRFRREARMMALVSHPNLVTIYDLHDETSGSWMVMEYVEGQNLHDVLEDQGPLHPETVMVILSQVANALSHMHSRHLVHLDVKPQNLIRTPDGAIKLIDFGLAQIAGAPQEMIGGAAFGTVAYLAPEQASGGMVDAATDVYSLGCVMYELLTGRTPFMAEGPDQKRQLIHAHLNSRPQAPSTVRPELQLPSWIDDVLGWALAKNRNDRFHDVETFVQMFEAGLEGETIRHPAHQTLAFEPQAHREAERTRIFRWGPSALNASHRSGPDRYDVAVMIPEARPVQEGPAKRMYRKGGRLARRSRRFRRLLWRLAALLLIANLLLALILMARDGPAVLVERLLSFSPGTSTEVITEILNMREAPGTTSPVILVLRESQEVKIAGLSEQNEQGRWWPVEVEQGNETVQGWVWEGGLKPNAWTGRLSWMQDVVDGVNDTKNGIQDGVERVLGLLPGVMIDLYTPSYHP